MNFRYSVIFVFILFSCIYFPAFQQDTLESQVSERVNYFEETCRGVFGDLQIIPLRNGKNTSYQVARYHTNPDYAIIRLYPKIKVEKNFFTDTIDLGFVQHFKNLHCELLISKESFIRMDIRNGKNKVIIYKGSSPKKNDLPFDTSKSIKILKGWSFFEYDKQDTI